jgi:hypothetical protein
MRRLPQELIECIFDFMASGIPETDTQRVFYPCLFVSRAWLPIAQARLYTVLEIFTNDARGRRDGLRCKLIARALTARPALRGHVRRLVVICDKLDHPPCAAARTVLAMEFHALASLTLAGRLEHTEALTALTRPCLALATEVAFRGTMSSARDCMLTLAHCKRATSLSVRVSFVGWSRGRTPELSMPTVAQLEVSFATLQQFGADRFFRRLDLPALRTLTLHLCWDMLMVGIFTSVPSVRHLTLHIPDGAGESDLTAVSKLSEGEGVWLLIAFSHAESLSHSAASLGASEAP